VKKKDNAGFHLIPTLAVESRISDLDNDGTSDASFILDLPDLFKSISFLNRTSVWQAFQGARKIALSWGYSIVGMSLFAKEGCKSQWADIKERCGLPQTWLTSFAMHLSSKGQ